MTNIRPFQIALLAGFGLLGILSLIFLANYSGVGGTEEQAYGDSVEIWGTIDSNAIQSTVSALAESDEGIKVVSYRQFDERSFVLELTDALAEGRGPDAVVVPSNLLVTLRSKLTPIPYNTYSLRTFRDNFIDGAEIFARPEGVYAFPFAVDPLVLYWNRDLFSSAGLVEPPATWEAFVSRAVPALTVRDANRRITQSAVAFGEYENIEYAKEVLLMMTMQAGGVPITEEESEYVVTINQPTSNNAPRPLTSSLQFYLDFSNRNSNRYSWDLSQPLDQTAFVGERLAMYFGLGSELRTLQQANPNLNFDITTVPQGEGVAIKRTYGNYYGFALVRASDNPNGTFAAIQRLVSAGPAASISQALGMAPASRSVLAAGTNDPYQIVKYQAAANARGWLDPAPEESASIFDDMISNVTSNRLELSEAVSEAVSRLAQIF